METCFSRCKAGSGARVASTSVGSADGRFGLAAGHARRVPARPSRASIPGKESRLRELVRVSRSGAATSLGLEPGYLRWPRLSPDGRRLALGSVKEGERGGAGGGVRDRAVDLQTRRRTWLDGYSEPVWSADGRRVVMSIGAQPLAGVGEQVADGSRPMQNVFTLETGDAWPTSTSRDGTWLVYYRPDGAGSQPTRDLSAVFVLDRRTGHASGTCVRGSSAAGGCRPTQPGWPTDDRRPAHRCPRGRLPGAGRRPHVSTDGGEEPAWSADGKELLPRRGGTWCGLRSRAAPKR